MEALRREKDVLQNELRSQQELVSKLQQQQHQNGLVHRSNKIDEVTLHQKEALEKKLSMFKSFFFIFSYHNKLRLFAFQKLMKNKCVH